MVMKSAVSIVFLILMKTTVTIFSTPTRYSQSSIYFYSLSQPYPLILLSQATLSMHIFLVCAPINS